MTQEHRGARTRGGAQRALFAVLFLALLVLLPASSAAQVITFSSASASWRDAQDNLPGSQPGDPVITNGVPTSSISWGVATTQSGYDVTITIPDPTQFPVADFTHRNFPVSDPSLTSVALDIVLDFEVDGIPNGPLTFTFTFTHEETPNGLDPCPYPTPPGEGCTDRVTFLDAPLPTTFTVGGKTYTLGLTFLDDSGNPVQEFITSEGGVANTAELDVQFELVPPVLEVAKSGPAMMVPGEPGIFTIDALSTGPNDAFNTTIRDLLPDGATGGMCDATPQVLSAQVFEFDGFTPVPGKGSLVQGTDFNFSYTGAPTCELVLTMLSAASAVGENERLIIRYQTQLDGDTDVGVTLTNVAGATEWFDDDVSNPLRGTYTETLSNGTVGVVDHEDAHDVSTDPLDYLFEKTAHDPVSGALITTAEPGDTIRYRLRLENRSTSSLAGLAFTDEIDRLNGSPLFVPGSLTLVTVPAGADTSGTDPNGGAAGTGWVDVRDLSVAAGESVLVEFDVTLLSPIADGTLITDQAELLIVDTPFGLSDDPGVNGAAAPDVSGDEDPTVLTVTALQLFQVEKVSAYVTGDPAVLLAGETLRYTITVKNVGNDDADDAVIRDDIPANTTYVPGSTTLNGNPVADGAGGLPPFSAGLLLQAPGDPTPGVMRADASNTPDNVATLVFDVVVDPGVIDGTVISNQAFVSAPNGGVVDQPSDDPRTPLADDPTRDVVGNSPLLFATKEVTIGNDQLTIGVVDPGDELHYTITLYNSGPVPATDVLLSDAVPTNTTYLADTVLLNAAALGPDGGVFPLLAGVAVSSSDLPPPLQGGPGGTLSPGEVAVVEFDVVVNAGVPPGTLISNQAQVATAEVPSLLTDGDGDPSTGPEPTVVVVGNAQLLTIAKQVAVVGGGPALPGSELEYVLQVRNVAVVPASQVVITDDLDLPVGGQLTFVPGSATMNGAAAGVTVVGSLLTADYSGLNGPLLPGETVTVRFRATLDASLAIGTTVTNVGTVTWNDPPQAAIASVTLSVGGVPGFGVLEGALWHDANFDQVLDLGERLLTGWLVDLYRNGAFVQSMSSDPSGAYRFGGLAPSVDSNDLYELRFRAPDAGPNTAPLGYAASPFVNGLQRIEEIALASGAILQNLDLPIEPNGVVYDALGRTPLPGVILTLLEAGGATPLPAGCFEDAVQQGQVTGSNGYYRFDLVFGASCPSGEDYLIAVSSTDSNYVNGLSQIIPPTFDASTAAFSVPGCPLGPDDAVAATAQRCEVQISEQPPPLTVAAQSAGTRYHVHLTLDDTQVPGSSQIFNNHIPLDPVLDGAVAIAKTASRVNVSRGELVPYQITIRNNLGVPIVDLTLVDRFPTGFRYVEGSARVDGVPIEPTVDGQELEWLDLGIGAASERQIQLLLLVGAGVGEGAHVNRAFSISSVTGVPLSGEATATVRVVPDPDFACTDVMGKVYDDANRNGLQDSGEKGLAGVRLLTPRGLVATTDAHGRYHITCAVAPKGPRGTNFSLKLDERTLPTGFRMSTRPNQIQRATRGKALRLNYGASIHRVVSLDMADPVFVPGSTEMRPQWRPRLGLLLDELEKGPAVLRLSYVADVEDEALVERRLAAVKKQIGREWKARGGGYDLDIEPEIFWRRGAPPGQSSAGWWRW